MAWNALHFGPGGVPPTSPAPDTISGLLHTKNDLDLDAYELEFVHGARTNEDKGKEIQAIVKKLGLQVTSHGPYYVNLNAQEEPKRIASVQRMIQSARSTYWCGGTSTAFHAAFLMKKSSEEVTKKVVQGLKEIDKVITDEGIKCQVRPEFAGKTTQWGSLKELIGICAEHEWIRPCIDFAHAYAYSLGKDNDPPAFTRILQELEKGLGKEILSDMHIQIAGIEYGATGERNHTLLEDSRFNWKAPLQALKEFNCKGVVIAETPDAGRQAQLLQKTFRSL